MDDNTKIGLGPMIVTQVQGRKPTDAQLAEWHAQHPEGPSHPLDEYLAFLFDHGHVSEEELEALTTALAPLRARFESLSTIVQVREELGQKTATVDTLRDSEIELWRQQDWIPWFDLGTALDQFAINRDDMGRYIRLLNVKMKNVPTFIDPQLQKGEGLFWLILRMYRLHAKERYELGLDEHDDYNPAQNPVGLSGTDTILINYEVKEVPEPVVETARTADTVLDEIKTLTKAYLDVTAPLVPTDKPDRDPEPPDDTPPRRKGRLSQFLANWRERRRS